MDYITTRRARFKGISGNVNIPYGTRVQCDNGCITFDGKALCYTTSENAHQYFARDDDGNGLLRGKLTQATMKRLAKRDKDYQARWDKVWSDEVCKPYRRAEFGDYWLWNNDWYEADIETLKYIANLVGTKIIEEV